MLGKLIENSMFRTSLIPRLQCSNMKNGIFAITHISPETRTNSRLCLGSTMRWFYSIISASSNFVVATSPSSY